MCFGRFLQKPAFLVLKTTALYNCCLPVFIRCGQQSRYKTRGCGFCGAVKPMRKKGLVCFMRLDKYLKVSRLIKRRTVANEACDAGKVAVNGKPARASYDVKVGDVLEITLGERTVRAQVLSVAETVRKEGAAELYRIL